MKWCKHSYRYEGRGGFNAGLLRICPGTKTLALRLGIRVSILCVSWKSLRGSISEACI